jgi:circadian clock protein KaiC
MSSVMDTWILLRDIEVNGERNRGIYVLKSRGTKHSNQIREFIITSNGIELRHVYIGTGGVLTGSAREAQESREREEEAIALETSERRKAHFERRKRALQAQMAALQAEIESEELEAKSFAEDDERRVDRSRLYLDGIKRSRFREFGL